MSDLYAEALSTFAGLFEVVGDGFGACVESVPGELFADADDFVA